MLLCAHFMHNFRRDYRSLDQMLPVVEGTEVGKVTVLRVASRKQEMGMGRSVKRTSSFGKLFRKLVHELTFGQMERHQSTRSRALNLDLWNSVVKI